MGKRKMKAWEKRTLKTTLLTPLLKVLRFPLLKANPKKNKWYRIVPPNCVSTNGQAYHGSIRIGTENKLMLMFHGGGVSWNEEMAARGTSIYTAHLDYGFYASESDLIADLATGHGISSKKPENPFHNWSVISISYSSGDFHAGTGDYQYTALDESKQILHHHGYTNYRAVMKEAVKLVGSPEKLMVTGFSAGGFGTALLTDDVMSLFPDCQDVTCLVDSGFMLYDGWREAAENVWKTPPNIYKRLHSNNITLDALQALYQDHGDKVRVLFICSTRDAALAEYWPYVNEGRLYADKAAGIAFQKDLTVMCRQLQDTIPGVGIFIFDTPISGKDAEKQQQQGLTQHCIALGGSAQTISVEGKTVVQWLENALNGKVECLGLELLEKWPD